MKLHKGFVAFILFCCFEALYLFFQAHGIVAGDSGDLVTAAVTFGVPHPPGYPLYTLIGWILSHIPLFTMSFRVGLISSLSHALAASFVFLYVYKVTRSMAPAVLASLLLAGNYLFFYYSVTPEVFGLFDAFVILLVYIWSVWHERGSFRYFYVGICVLSLASFHHQVIVFGIPAIAYLVHHHKKRFHKNTVVTILKSIVVGVVGLLPYIYVLVAARHNSMVNWDRAVNIKNLIHLITRADYGSFVSGASYGTLINQRLVGLKAFVEFLFIDVSIVGVVLALLGVVYLLRFKKTLGIFLLIFYVIIGPVFLFYASFPLYNNFNLATYERFLLPSYVLLSVFIGVGVHGAILLWKKLWSASSRATQRVYMVTFLFVLFLYPVLLGIRTIRRFDGFATDFTADNVGIDILTPLPQKSILIVNRDTTLFSTEYVRYALNYRQDIAVFQYGLLPTRDYQIVVQKNFPDIVFPKAIDKTFYSTFVSLNQEKWRIFSNERFALSATHRWVPYGLVVESTSIEELPALETLIEQNNFIRSAFHDPRDGILSVYRHLMLSDVLDVYAEAHIEYAEILNRGGKLGQAEKELQSAIRLDGDITAPISYVALGNLYIEQKRCDEALDAFKQAGTWTQEATRSLYNQARTYKECYGEEIPSKRLMDEYEAKRSQEEGILKR